MVFFFIFLFDSGATFDLIFLDTFLGLLLLELGNNFHRAKEVVEGHGAILLVLGLAQFFSFLDKLCNNLWW